MPKRKSDLGHGTRNVQRMRYQEGNPSNDVTTVGRDLFQSWKSYENAAFSYDPCIEYNKHASLNLGTMTRVCEFCGALKWQCESDRMCCEGGKVSIPILEEPPCYLKTLLVGDTNDSKEFLRNPRQYNSCFQMTSFRVSGNTETCPTTFTVQGQIHHYIGGLLPTSGEEKFLQIYFMEEHNVQLNRRYNLSKGLQREIVSKLQHILNKENLIIQSLKTALNIWPSDQHKVIIRADRRPLGEHEKWNNTPENDDIAVLTVGNDFGNRDVVLAKHKNTLIRVSESHRFYDALQYPLIFWKGQEGYNFSIPQINPTRELPHSSKKVSLREFYCYMMMVRNEQFNSLLRYRSLLNQFIVDMYVKIESERLLYIRRNQKILCSEQYIDLTDAMDSDTFVNASNLGQRVILPSSFTGGPRYMHEHAQDALSYVQEYGRPDLFVTMTCNPKWPEITEALFPGQSAKDRHDIVARVFRQKVNNFMDVVTKGEIFGRVRCWMYTVEWQKTGLPHIHALIWFVRKIDPKDVDKIISAEIPSQNADPILHGIITKNMVHGPCGSYNPKLPCMKNGKCSERYPRAFTSETRTNRDGYPLYRRRSPEDGGFTFKYETANKSNLEVDNRWIVPHCPILSKMFNSHINVELCSSVKSIKHICKYIHKGSNQAALNIQRERGTAEVLDEVANFQRGRYISTNEAVWRIFKFPVHDMYPTVTHLSIHLENGRREYSTEDNLKQQVQNPPNSTLTAFFKLCERDPFARTLLYCEVPHYYTWNPAEKNFQRRVRGTRVEGQEGIFYCEALGRVYNVSVHNYECFCLRMLLLRIRGPTSFSSLKIIGDRTYSTFQEACEALECLQNDQHWDCAMQESMQISSARYMRHLFAIMLCTCGLSTPHKLWDKYKEAMVKDTVLRFRDEINTSSVTETIYHAALAEIQDHVFSAGGRELSNYGLPKLAKNTHRNNEVQKELDYNIQELQMEVDELLPQLLPEQLNVFNIVMEQVNKCEGAVYFLDAPGGTGKTFLLNLLLKQVRRNKNIAIAVASSGIAATLLTGGRTAYSALKLPYDLVNRDTPVCYMSKNSERAEVLRRCKLLVWDECTMSHKKAVECLNRTLQNIRGSSELMGGLVVLLAGDFRQTLPVIPKGTAADEINACLKKSFLWPNIKRLHLTQNMRVQLHNDFESGQFSSELLKIGEGKCKVDFNGRMLFPEAFCNFVESLDDLINKVFPYIVTSYHSAAWLCERAILAPTNEDVHPINSKIMEMLPGQSTTFFSIDTVINSEQAMHYPVEVLNSLELPGIPSHKLDLKPGVPVILLRNLNSPKLCNGTRLVIKDIKTNIVGCVILTGCAKGEYVLIPRIPIVSSGLPFKFKRIQFPLKVSFAMTINKAQGQTLKVAGINLQRECFSHGQLYVACSRVSSRKNLYINVIARRTKNVVYKSILED